VQKLLILKFYCLNLGIILKEQKNLLVNGVTIHHLQEGFLNYKDNSSIKMLY